MLAIPLIFLLCYQSILSSTNYENGTGALLKIHFYCFVEDLEIIPWLLLNISIFLCKTYKG